MKQTYDSLEELMSSCATSGLTSCLPHSLLLKRSENWELVSGFTNDGECHAEFVSRPAVGEPPAHITWRCSGQGEYGYMELLLSA